MTFAAQTVHNTDDRYYKITQTAAGTNAGMQYDEGYYLIKVTTAEDPQNPTQLKSEISEILYYPAANAEVPVAIDLKTGKVQFTNVYGAETDPR